MASFQVPHLDVKTVETALTTRSLGRRLVYKQVTGSTMDDARELAIEQDCPHGTVVVAEKQTRGRGAKDHKWDSSNTGNIYMSIVLYLSPQRASLQGRFTLEVAACLAVRQAVHDLGVTKAVCKWPNDIWVRGHKLAGFLIEDETHTRKDSTNEVSSLIILGIGINVNADVRRSSTLAAIATSIRCELGGALVNRETFLADICNRLEASMEWTVAECMEKFIHLNVFQKGMSVSVHDISADRHFDAVFSSIEEDWEICLTDVENEVGDTGQTVKGNSRKFSLRPRCPRQVLVCCAASSCNQSAQALHHSLSGLVDTSRCDVRFLSAKEMTSDDWQSKCVLLAVGETTGLTDQELKRTEEAIRRQMTSGQSVLCVGGGARLMCGLLGSGADSREIKTEDAGAVEGYRIRLPDGDESFTYLSPHAPLTFDPSLSSQVLASYADRQGQRLGAAVVIVQPPLSGKVCLCGFSIELLHSAPDGEGGEVGVLTEEAFDRDALLCDVLKELMPSSF